MSELGKEIRARVSIIAIAQEGGLQVEKRGKRNFILCPWHDEKTASAELYDDEGRGYCHGCKKPFDVIDLRARLHGCSTSEVIKDFAEKFGLGGKRPWKGKSNGTLVATYDYVDLGGKLSYQACRYDDKEEKSFSQRRPDGIGGWIDNLNGVEPIPYRLQELKAALNRGDTVYIVEGEKDADTLTAFGFSATTNSGGAGKWTERHSKHFSDGAKVVIFPDNDEPGRKHAESVASQLVGRGCLVKIVEPPGLPPKGDVSDWLQAGHTKEDLLLLVEQAPYLDRDSLDKWPDIIPLSGAIVPSFPVDTLPERMANFVSEISESTQTPPDLSAILILDAIAAAVAKKAVIIPRKGWTEPLNIYSVIAMPPASRKSAVFAEITAPLIEYERMLIEQQKAVVLATKANYRMIETALEKAKDTAAKLKAEGKTANVNLLEELARDLAAAENPSMPRILADDITLEQAGIMLADQGGRLAIMSAEGDLFDILGGRYNSSGGINLGVILKSHSGDSLRVDRVGRASVSVDRPALTIGLAIQPDVLRGLCQKPGFRGRGLLGRFMYSLPDSNIGQRKIVTEPVNEATKWAYARSLTKLLELPPAKEAAILSLAPDAKRTFEDFEERVERSLGAEGSLSAIPDWGGKLCGAVARIAGIIHMASVGLACQEVSDDTVRRAIKIGEYLEVHALAAFGLMGGDEVIETAGRILKTIDRQQWETFTQRDIYQILKGSFKTVDELLPGLSLLTERGYIRKREGVPKVGRPSVVYEVNPKYAPQYPRYPQKFEARESLEDFGDSGDSGEGISSHNSVDDACRAFDGVLVEGCQYWVDNKS